MTSLMGMRRRAMKVAASGSLVSDSFNRADGALGNADTGQAWTLFPSLSNFRVISNQAGLVATGSLFNATVETNLADCTVQCTVTALPSGGRSSCICARLTDADNYWRYGVGGTTSDVLFIQKSVAGSLTTVYSEAGRAAGDVLKLVLSGSTIELYRNGVLKATLTDSFNSTATKHGLHIHEPDDPITRLDDFSVVA